MRRMLAFWAVALACAALFGAETYYSCEGCHKSFLDEAGMVEFEPSESGAAVVNTEVSGRQIPDMTERSCYLKVGSQISSDSLGLSRRLDDY